jgi:hypothetical protein
MRAPQHASITSADYNLQCEHNPPNIRVTFPYSLVILAKGKALALITSPVLFTVAALNFPFKGDITIGPEAMELVLHTLENSKLSDL